MSSRLQEETARLSGGERVQRRVCPACGMGVDDPALDRCPLCFYDLDAAPPERDVVVMPDSGSAPEATLAPTGRPRLSALDVAIALLPLVVLLVVLFVALSQK